MTSVVIRPTQSRVIKTVVSGPPGPPGATGATGPAGASGSGAASYVHHQGVASAAWAITHDLGFVPSVTVVDSAGSLVEGDVTEITNTSMTLIFSASFAGTAYLS